jgi:hypothetical protein
MEGLLFREINHIKAVLNISSENQVDMITPKDFHMMYSKIRIITHTTKMMNRKKIIIEGLNKHDILKR